MQKKHTKRVNQTLQGNVLMQQSPERNQTFLDAPIKSSQTKHNKEAKPS